MSFFKRRTANYDNPEANIDIFRLVKPGSRVLDVGCASGKLAEWLKMRKNCFVVGIESDEDLAKKAEHRCDTVIKADVATLHTLPFPKGYFDYIIFADVLEHLPNPDEVLMNLRDYLSEEGSVLLSVPNIANWEIRLKLLCGCFDYGHPLLDGGHLRFFTLSSIRQLLEEAGYKVTYVTNRNARITMLGRLWKSLFAFQFIIKAERFN